MDAHNQVLPYETVIYGAVFTRNCLVVGFGCNFPVNDYWIWCEIRYVAVQWLCFCFVIKHYEMLRWKYNSLSGQSSKTFCFFLLWLFSWSIPFILYPLPEMSETESYGYFQTNFGLSVNSWNDQLGRPILKHFFSAAQCEVGNMFISDERPILTFKEAQHRTIITKTSAGLAETCCKKVVFFVVWKKKRHLTD